MSKRFGNEQEKKATVEPVSVSPLKRIERVADKAAGKSAKAVQKFDQSNSSQFTK